MKTRTFSILLLSLTLFSCGGAKEDSPESLTKSFINKLSQGDCNGAKAYTTGNAEDYIGDLVKSGCSSFESNIKFIKCETSEETAKCDCEESRDGVDIEYSYFLKKSESSWVITDVEGGANPEAIVTSFVQFLADGECEKAKALTFGKATSYIDEQSAAGCASYATSIDEINCVSSKESASCSVFEVRNKKNFNFNIEVIKGGGLGWRISEVEGGQDPREVVREFVLALANGDCKKAKKISSGNASETVGASMDMGCEPYDTRVTKVECEVDDKIAECSCYETRTGMDMKFDYELEQIDGEWMVVEYKKDMEEKN